MAGPRLMIDAYGCDRARLGDLDWLTQALLDFATQLGLALKREPHVFRFAGETAEDWGLSAVALFQGSRLTIHTYPTKSFFSLDFSPLPCGLDLEIAQRFLRDHFSASRVEMNPLGHEGAGRSDAF